MLILSLAKSIDRMTDLAPLLASKMVVPLHLYDPHFVSEPDKPKAKTTPVIEPRMLPYWEQNVDVSKLNVGDHVRLPKLSDERKITAIKPHPKGGVMIKSIPVYFFKKKVGKTLKFHLTGHASRWDGTTFLSS